MAIRKYNSVSVQLDNVLLYALKWVCLIICSLIVTLTNCVVLQAYNVCLSPCLLNRQWLWRYHIS